MQLIVAVVKPAQPHVRVLYVGIADGAGYMMHVYTKNIHVGRASNTIEHATLVKPLPSDNVANCRCTD